MKISLLRPAPPGPSPGEAGLEDLDALARALGYAGVLGAPPETVSSEPEVRRRAAAGRPVLLPPLAPDRERRLVALYAAVSGRPTGERVAHLRDLLVADSDEEALALWSDTGLCGGRPWFEDTTDADLNLFEDSLVLVGSVATVRRQLAALRARTAAREIVAWVYPGRVDRRALARSLALFASRVLPGLGGA